MKCNYRLLTAPAIIRYCKNVNVSSVKKVRKYFKRPRYLVYVERTTTIKYHFEDVELP